jgi:uncharacterized protein YkwD
MKIRHGTATLASLAICACNVPLGEGTDIGEPRVVTRAPDETTTPPDEPVALFDAESAAPPPAAEEGATEAAYTDPEGHFIELINRERTSRGLAPLARYWDLDDDMDGHSARMRDAGHIFHSEDLTVFTPYWLRLGENVGRGPSVESLHAAFMASPGHRANILQPDYDHVGVGVTLDGSTIWVGVAFMQASRPGLTATHPPFNDDDFSIHERNVRAIWERGITQGCGPKRFCPERTLTRAEMAVFLTRALALTPSGTDWFVDDDGAWYERSVDSLAEARITVGCNPPANDRFCPTNELTRGQMALFLVRGFGYGPASADYFADDDGAYYEDAANRIRQAGVTEGCGGDRYCGDEPVTREQMASFLARALAL